MLLNDTERFDDTTENRYNYISESKNNKGGGLVLRIGSRLVVTIVRSVIGSGFSQIFVNRFSLSLMHAALSPLSLLPLIGMYHCC